MVGGRREKRETSDKKKRERMENERMWIRIEIMEQWRDRKGGREGGSRSKELASKRRGEGGGGGWDGRMVTKVVMTG